jgi:acyl-CoA synthetase (AMP-forming)/AMP-acid ligase II
MRDGIAWSADLIGLARRFGACTAVTDGVATLDYTALAARAHGLARRLLAEGLRPGEPVASLVPNGPDAVWVSFGLTVAGAAETPINVAATDAELAWYAQLAGFRRVVSPAAAAGRLAGLGLAPLALDDIAPEADPAPLPPVPAEAWGRIMFTSGTTGRPKAVVHGHGGRWTAHLLQRATLPFVPEAGERVLLMTPFPHGASLLTYAWLDYGGEVMLLPGVLPERIAPLLDSAGTLAAIFAPPTVLAKLLALFPGRRFAGVRYVFCGTQALTPELHARAVAAFGRPVVRVTYGMTECFNPITVLAPPDLATAMAETEAADAACVGWPAPGVEVAIHAEEDGTTLPAGEVGEIRLRARQMHDGIIGPDGFRPRAAGAWHRTGDLGRLDARGRLWLAGRAADVIKTGGYRVHPAEVETVLAGAAGEDRTICVLGLPSDYWGEVIVAVAEGAAPGWEREAMLRAEQLAKYKRPRAWPSLPALPRNAQGKLVRARLQEAILTDHVLEDGPHPHLEPRRSAAGPG